MSQVYSYRVVSSGLAAPRVQGLVLEPVGALLPVWQAGAHVRVALPDGGDRPYSLFTLPDMADGQIGLGVLLEEQSTGGSRYMHSLMAGDIVTLSAPENHFPLGEDTAPVVLLAGGIGITPILAMAQTLSAEGRAFTAHYAGREAGALAFVDAMQAICGEALHLHYDNADSRLDIDAMLSSAPAAAQLYVCGPAGLIEAVKARAAAVGFGADRIHYELFKADAPSGADSAFEVEIASTGQVVQVAADQTIVAALEAAGLSPLYDCLRGDCGICQVAVKAGLPDHRDVILTESERASNAVMQICVSRAKTPRLVLDI